MTREEAIKGLTSLVEVRKKYCNMQTMKDEIECLDIAIKALEQDSVLDKIRAEIESCREDEKPHLCDYRYHRNEGLDKALEIIDKYKAESEEVEK